MFPSRLPTSALKHWPNTPGHFPSQSSSRWALPSTSPALRRSHVLNSQERKVPGPLRSAPLTASSRTAKEEQVSSVAPATDRPQLTSGPPQSILTLGRREKGTTVGLAQFLLVIG